MVIRNHKKSRLLLSRLRLSGITAYLEVKIKSLFKHENLTTGNKILWKRGENFSSFPQYFQYNSDFRSQMTYSFVKCGCSTFFPHFCKSDMSRYGYLEVFLNPLDFEITRIDCINNIKVTDGGTLYGRHTAFTQTVVKIYVIENK